MNLSDFPKNVMFVKRVDGVFVLFYFKLKCCSRCNVKGIVRNILLVLFFKHYFEYDENVVHVLAVEKSSINLTCFH